MKTPNYEFLDAKITASMLKLFRGERTGWVQVGDKKWLFPSRYCQQGEGFYRFKARPDDVWVLSYPRSGTTWTMELVWLLSNNLDFETAKTQLLAERFPFLEFSLFHHPEVTREFVEINRGNPEKQQFCLDLARPGYEVLEGMSSPRFIKSHFPFSLLPGILDSGCKVVYVARNPKDVAVSWYHLNRAIKTQGYKGDFPTFWDFFERNLTPWSPYWEHLKEAWERRHHPNLLFLFYEEMYWDLPDAISRVGRFLGKNDYSPRKIQQLVEHLNVSNFRSNPMINSSELRDCGIIEEGGEFVRNGRSGGWRNTFTPDLEARADAWIARNSSITDIAFPHFPLP